MCKPIFRLVIREKQYARRDDNAVLLMDKVEIGLTNFP